MSVLENEMDMSKFHRDFPYLAGALVGDFHDPDHGDAFLARRVRSDLNQNDRVKFIARLIDETRSALEKIDGVWENISKASNRTITGPAAGRAWLAQALREWEGELKRISGK